MITIERAIETDQEVTKLLSSGRLVVDADGKLYLSYICHNAATGLLAIDAKTNTVIEAGTIAFPLRICSEQTIIRIVNKETE